MVTNGKTIHSIQVTYVAFHVKQPSGVLGVNMAPEGRAGQYRTRLYLASRMDDDA